MYRTVPLAYDGSREGWLALREGALIARILGASVVLLILAQLQTALQPVDCRSGNL
jgi:hypothetical protein